MKNLIIFTGACLVAFTEAYLCAFLFSMLRPLVRYIGGTELVPLLFPLVWALSGFVLQYTKQAFIQKLGALLLGLGGSASSILLISILLFFSGSVKIFNFLALSAPIALVAVHILYGAGQTVDARATGIRLILGSALSLGAFAAFAAALYAVSYRRGW